MNYASVWRLSLPPSVLSLCDLCIDGRSLARPAHTPCVLHGVTRNTHTNLCKRCNVRSSHWNGGSTNSHANPACNPVNTMPVPCCPPQCMPGNPNSRHAVMPLPLLLLFALGQLVQRPQQPRAAVTAQQATGCVEVG